MRRAKALFSISILVGALALVTTEASADKWALMVGINDYPELPAQCQLRGCKSDIDEMHDLFISKFGFQKDHIKTLLNREATRDAMVQWFRTWLIEKPKPGDMVLFYYSGHGSQVEDQNGDEEDGLDETLVPADISRTHPERMIIDDEIGEWIKQIEAKGIHNIVFVLDCCHSGTATKGLDDLFKKPEQQCRSKYVQPKLILGHDVHPKAMPAAATKNDADTPDDVVLISGCRDSETSNDAPVEGGGYHGALTYTLAGALQKAAAGITYQQLMEQVRREVSNRFPTQTPQLSGPGTRQAFQDIQVTPTPPFVMVTQATGGRAQLDAGTSAGVTVGSTYRVYPADDRALTGDGIGEIEITRALPATAEARVRRGAGAVRAGCRAVEQEHVFPQEKLYLALGAGSDAAGADVVKTLKQIDYVVMADDGHLADRLVQVKQAGGGLNGWVATPDGMPGRTFTAADAAELAQAMRPELDGAYTMKLLARLQNPNPSFKVHVSIDREASPIYYFEKDEIKFKVQAERDCYITVLDIGTSGKIAVLFPNKEHPENLIRANEVYEIPSATMGFAITVNPPVGREMVKVIATEKPVNLTGIDFKNMEGTFAGVEDSMSFVRKLAGSVKDIVVTARRKPTGTPTGGWATDFVTFQIRDPAELKKP